MGVARGSSEIGLPECCDILEESEVLESLDIGSAVIHKVRHPARGDVTLVNTSCGRAALIK